MKALEPDIAVAEEGKVREEAGEDFESCVLASEEEKAGEEVLLRFGMILRVRGINIRSLTLGGTTLPQAIANRDPTSGAAMRFKRDGRLDR